MISERVTGDEASPSVACLLTFFALAFAWSWACWWLAPALEADTPALVLHTAVNTWSSIIPVMVLPDGSNLRPFQIVVGISVITASALLLGGDRTHSKGMNRT